MSLSERQSGPGSRLLFVTWFLLVLACCVAIVLGMRAWNTSPLVDVVVRMSTTTHGNVQLFTRVEGGYTEKRSVTLALVGDGLAHDYATRLSGLSAPGAFRIDPGSSTGQVALHWIDLAFLGEVRRLEGPALRKAVRPLNDLISEDHGTDGMSFRSQGSDPFMEVLLPDAIVQGNKILQHRGLLLALSGLIGLATLLWLARSRLRTAAARGPGVKALAVFVIATSLGLGMMAALQTGCDGLCSPEGAGYGAALLLAALAMAVVGAAIVQALGLGAARTRIRIFLWIAVGQTALIVYVFLRSALHAFIPFLPVGAVELALLVVAAALYLWRGLPRPWFHRTPRQVVWLSVELALLVVVCLVVADRELPRLVMLSSDPDIHAYLARQLEVLGGIPWRGEAAFNYPAGTAAIGFIWTKLSLLDVRNAVTALPLLQSFLAALMLGEALSLRIRQIPARLLLLLTTLGVTAAGLLIPLYTNYSHMEGAGRQIAIATAAVIPALLLSGGNARTGADRRIAVVLLGSLFALGVLNPISAVVPIILAIAYMLYVAAAHRRISWWLAALLVLPVFLLLDPYYFHLATGSGPSELKITVDDAKVIKTVPEVLSAWGHYIGHPVRFLNDGLAMGPGQGAPMFAVFLAAILALRMALKPMIRVNRSALLAIGLAVLALFAADGLFAALRDDRRFYLLAPYYAFTLGQLKILLITALAASTILVGRVKGLRLPALAIMSLLMVLMVRIGMHSTQRYALEPRVGYCGSLGCVSADDIEVMRHFERMSTRPGAAPSSPGRVLVPNSVHDTPNEDWVFPVAGARALPFFDVPPVAFFYYQGDVDYTTENYKAHVCRRFDRDWLKRQGVAYVFLPSVRGAACMSNMELLPVTEEIIIQRGNSYLLRLR